MIPKRYLFLLLVLLAIGGISYAVFSKSGHTFSETQCQDCHAMTPVKGQRETLAMREPIRDLCRRCHNDYLKNSLTHPVDMVPVDAVPPADLPLSLEGRMTCSTCHDIHASAQDPLSPGRAYLRRSASGAALCSACHRTGVSSGQKRQAPAMAVAHMKFSENTTPAAGQIDRLSRMCLTCHDGTLGSDVNTQVSAGSWKHGPRFNRTDPQGSHPIGVKYRAASQRGGYRPAGMLNKAIRLIEGKIGCASCHDLFSKELHLLVVPNARLCTECHDK